MNGIIIIDKPQGWTSMDVCAKVRGVLRERRVGHAGTLDPMATGVLPLFIGRATRAVEFAAEGDKEYIAALRLGVTTTTQDITGTVLEERPAAVTQADLEAVLARFRGEIDQLPPMYSAIKIKGQKLYDLARKGVEVDRKSRRITVHALELLDWPGEGADIPLRVRCSKGTYVRTLCHDIGQALGCGGCMAALRRTAVAGYTLDDAVTLDALLAAEDPAALLRPTDSGFYGYDALDISGRPLLQAKNGTPFPCSAADGTYRVYGPGGEFLLLGEVKAGTCRTIKSFFEV